MIWLFCSQKLLLSFQLCLFFQPSRLERHATKFPVIKDKTCRYPLLMLMELTYFPSPSQFWTTLVHVNLCSQSTFHAIFQHWHYYIISPNKIHHKRISLPPSHGNMIQNNVIHMESTWTLNLSIQRSSVNNSQYVMRRSLFFKVKWWFFAANCSTYFSQPQTCWFITCITFEFQ